MAKVKYNVGVFIGTNGDAILYTAEAVDGGPEFIVFKEKPTSGADFWNWMTRSSLDAQMALGKVTISSSVNFDSLLNVLPAGVLDGEGHVNITNDASPALPRLFTNQPYYSLKGATFGTYEGDPGKSITGDAASRNGSGTIVINGSSKTITETVKEGIDWVMKNPWILVAIIAGAVYLFGVPEILKSKKRKTARARR